MKLVPGPWKSAAPVVSGPRSRATSHATPAPGRRARGRHEPRQGDAIVAAELERALAEPDPLRSIAGLVAGWAAAFALDPDGVPRGGALGSERMARRLADALPAEHPLRDVVRAFLRPMLSPRLAELHRDSFTVEVEAPSTVDLEARRAESDLDALDLGDGGVEAA